MAVDQNVELMYHGVGTSQLVFTDGSFITIAESKDLEISVEATEGEIEGGDGYFALLTYITKKTGTITINDAIMTLPAIKAATGANITDSAEIHIFSDIKTVTSGSATLSKTTGIVTDSVLAKVVDTGEYLKRVTGTPSTGQFAVTSAGVVTTGSALDGEEVEFSYRYSDSTGKSVNLLETDVPKNCELRHQLITDEMPDGKRYQLDIVVYRGKAKGSYTYSAKRGEAFVPKLEFSILNAKRSDKKTISYNISEYVE